MPFTRNTKRRFTVSLRLIRTVSNLISASSGMDSSFYEAIQENDYQRILILATSRKEESLLHMIDELGHTQDALFDSLNALISEWEAMDYEEGDLLGEICDGNGLFQEMDCGIDSISAIVDSSWSCHDQAEIDMVIELMANFD
ncbi:hypothetical protein K493DRAFT_354074 [Basidiobolus meristosporus CBS 931.73]|uniref:Uncharacterized protein n=1 Tax=Basidiobolus meristosporus CBS 931.73 TaxID=1314790 RepID=A0A1Y1Y430_9FUNG|nr:hypothetical protein K493DRAFT_354074 [Basidiobolus meristosporus CBS 931.73]|eukprot:ORX92767.1 hypothetical protein K493DRAFT_354074 [Basidiobolus meristosporus CBS 931.73]